MQRLDVPGDDRQRLRLPEHSGTAVVEQHPAGGVIDDIDIPVVGRETLHLQILSGTPAVPVNDERHAARHVVGHDLAASEVADIDQPVPEQQFIGAPERRSLGKLQRQEIHPTDPIRNRRRRLLPESQHTVADDPLLPSGNAGGKSAQRQTRNNTSNHKIAEQKKRSSGTGRRKSRDDGHGGYCSGSVSSSATPQSQKWNSVRARSFGKRK